MHRRPTFSLIVPTRQRPAQLGRLLDSLAATAARPEALEVVLVIDADDPASVRVAHARLAVKRVVVEPGLPMGALNTAGYQASSGKYLMLLNDDVVARTPGWDDRFRACFRRVPDGIALVHPNDTLFRDLLCTFPVVSRTFCRLAGGICPAEYRRYRIDDHIEDVFNLLAALGERRVFYLPDVVFEHLNTVALPQGGRAYESDPAVLAVDAPRFEALFAERKELALRLREYVAGGASAAVRGAWRRRLDAVPDSFSLRVPGRQRLDLRGRLHQGRERAAALVGRARACVWQQGYAGLVRALARRLVRAEPARPC
jgi:glycosyltransferase involved in cell wall biosynthesis